MTAAAHRHSESVNYTAMSQLYVQLTVLASLLQTIATGNEIAHSCASLFAGQFIYPQPYPFTQDSHGYPGAWSTGHAPTAGATTGGPELTEALSPPPHYASPRYCAAPLHETQQQQPHTPEFADHGDINQYGVTQVHSPYAQTANLNYTPQVSLKVDADDNSITPSPGYTESPKSYYEFNEREHCGARRNLFSGLKHQSLGKLRFDLAEELGDEVQEDYSTNALPENVVEIICLEYATARNELLSAEMCSWMTIVKIKAQSDECASRTRLLCDEIYDTGAVLRSQLEWMEESSRKELTQRAMAYDNLVTQLQREQILHRSIITSQAEERRRLLGQEHLQYHTRVLAWTAKAHSHGQQKERWKKFAVQHLNPFTHTPDSLHRYLRFIGVLRDAYAYNLSSSSSKQQWATTTHKIPTAEPGDGQNNPSDCSKVDPQQAKEQSENGTHPYSTW